MKTFRILLIFGAIWGFQSVSQARAATLEISYASLERIIVKRVMTEGGRHYMEGDASKTCLYSFIQEPRVDAVGERLRITVLYAGRAGKEIAGKCVGPGDNFDLQVSGVPVFENGELYLSELKVNAPDTAYFKLVSSFVESELKKDLRYPVTQGLDRAAAEVTAAGNGKLSWESVKVDSITVGETSVKMSFDFGLSLRP
jgi:hypothetical protein